jgi:hypothetical protein
MNLRAANFRIDAFRKLAVVRCSQLLLNEIYFAMIIHSCKINIVSSEVLMQSNSSKSVRITPHIRLMLTRFRTELLSLEEQY